MGLDVVADETFADTDFSAQLTKIQQANPDVICVAGLYQESALIAKKAREMGMNQPIIGGNGFNSPAYIKQAGAAANGSLVATSWNPESDTPKAKHFIEAFKDKYGHEPDQFAAQAYDAMYLMHDAALLLTARSSVIPWLESRDLKALLVSLNLMLIVTRRWILLFFRLRMASGFRSLN